MGIAVFVQKSSLTLLILSFVYRFDAFEIGEILATVQLLWKNDRMKVRITFFLFD